MLRVSSPTLFIKLSHRQLRAGRVLMLQLNNVSLRTRRALYAVKAQTSLAPMSRFRGSRVTTAHEQQCSGFSDVMQRSVPSRMKLTMREPTFLGSITTDDMITASYVGL